MTIKNAIFMAVMVLGMSMPVMVSANSPYHDKSKPLAQRQRAWDECESLWGAPSCGRYPTE